MNDCNFTYLNINQLSDVIDTGDESKYINFWKDYPHIFAPNTINLNNDELEDTEWIVIFSFLHWEFIHFHNSYCLLMQKNKDDKDYINNSQINHQNEKVTSIYSQSNNYGDHLDLYIDQFVEKSFPERLIFVSFFAFFERYLFSFVNLLSDKSLFKERQTEYGKKRINILLEEIKLNNRHEKKDYVIYGKCIDKLCGIEDFSNLFNKKKFAKFKYSRNSYAHDFDSLSKSNKVDICDCFMIVKETFDLFFYSNHVRKKFLSDTLI